MNRNEVRVFLNPTHVTKIEFSDRTVASWFATITSRMAETQAELIEGNTVRVTHLVTWSVREITEYAQGFQDAFDALNAPDGYKRKVLELWVEVKEGDIDNDFLNIVDHLSEDLEKTVSDLGYDSEVLVHEDFR